MFISAAVSTWPIPPGQVAVQRDVAVEFAVLEEAFAPGGLQAFDVITAVSQELYKV